MKVVAYESLEVITMVEDAKRVSRGLERIGWPPIHYTHRGLHEQLARLFQGPMTLDVEQEAERLICRHYREGGLRSLLEDWKSNRHVQRRYHILGEAVQCHEAELWHAAVQLWYSQVEGLIKDTLAAGRPRLLGVQGYLDLITTPHFRIPAWSGLRAFAKTQAWNQYLLHDDARAPNSRHGAAHGLSTDYGTEENAIKAMLLFDFVQDAVQTAIIWQGDAAHLAGCRRIKSDPKDLVFFQNLLWALVAGWGRDETPCATCGEQAERLLSPRTERLIKKRIDALKPRLAAPLGEEE